MTYRSSPIIDYCALFDWLIDWLIRKLLWFAPLSSLPSSLSSCGYNPLHYFALKCKNDSKEDLYTRWHKTEEVKSGEWSGWGKGNAPRIEPTYMGLHGETKTKLLVPQKNAKAQWIPEHRSGLEGANNNRSIEQATRRKNAEHVDVRREVSLSESKRRHEIHHCSIRCKMRTR